MNEIKSTNRSKERYSKIKKGNKNLLITANIILGISLSGGIGFAIYFFKNHDFVFDRSMVVADFATFLTGTIGLLITTSSILYLIYNLRIQNESLFVSIEDVELTLSEIQESNQNFLKQKQENTFFNLLDYHTRLTSNFGVDSLKQFFTSVKRDLEIYKTALENKSFSSFSQTALNPQNISMNKIEIKPLIQNIIHIDEYIKNTLENNEFYKNTLFSAAMSECEQFYLGMLISNKIIPLEDTQYQGYTKFFYQTSVYRNFHLDGVFPILEIKHNNAHSPNLLFQSNFSEFQKQLAFRLILVKNYRGKRVFYKGYYIDAKHDHITESKMIQGPMENIELHNWVNTYDINFYDLELEEFIALAANSSNFREKRIHLYLKMYFKCQINLNNDSYSEFTIKHKVTLHLSRYENQLEGWVTNN